MEGQYKVIDGVIYKAVDTNAIKSQAEVLKTKLQPYIDGIAEANRCIATYQSQIDSYNKQITDTIAASGIDAEAVKLVDPDLAKSLGF